MSKINYKVLKRYIGQPVIVELDDHAMGDDIVPCRCMGWLNDITNKKITVVAWDLINPRSPEERYINAEFISLSKASITAIHPMKLIKKWS